MGESAAADGRNAPELAGVTRPFGETNAGDEKTASGAVFIVPAAAYFPT